MIGPQQRYPRTDRGIPRSQQSIPRSDRSMPRSQRSMPRSDRSMPRSQQSMPRSDRSMPRSKQSMPRSDRSMLSRQVWCARNVQGNAARSSTCLTEFVHRNGLFFSWLREFGQVGCPPLSPGRAPIRSRVPGRFRPGAPSFPGHLWCRQDGMGRLTWREGT